MPDADNMDEVAVRGPQQPGPDAEPFVDTPVKQAQRRAFDNPTHENLNRLVRAALESTGLAQEVERLRNDLGQAGVGIQELTDEIRRLRTIEVTAQVVSGAFYSGKDREFPTGYGMAALRSALTPSVEGGERG